MSEIFRIAAETHREFGIVINAVKAAELLDLVDTPKRLVVLEPAGLRVLRASPEARKVTWREQLLKLALFVRIKDALEHNEHHKLKRELVLELLIFLVPNEDYEHTFETLVAWARFGDLFSYDEGTEELALQ